MSPRGLHFFDRHSGSNILFDEVTAEASCWSVAPAYLSIALTNACDLECAYCYAPKHASRLRPADVVKWCREADRDGSFGVGFGGGEPTLYPGFCELINELATTTSLSISFTTHGHRLTDALLDKLGGRVQFVRISMDGTGTVYERLRGRSFNSLLDRVRRVRSLFKFGINVVVNSDTLPCLSDIGDVAAAEGASQLLLLPELRAGQLTLDPTEQARLESWINDHSTLLPLSISGRGSETLTIPRLDISMPAFQDHEFLHIDADGILKRCAFDCSGVGLLELGSLREAISRLRSSPCLAIL